MFQNPSDAILDILEQQSSKTYSHTQFRNLWRRTIDDGGLRSETSEVDYKTNRSVYLYDDLKPVLRMMDRHPDDYELCRRDFDEFINDNRYVHLFSLSGDPGKYRWYNTTGKGINLRPGITEASGKMPPAVTLSGQTSHAIIGGRTGSGKSVFLNNLILNILIEYAPWEIELYLADFKKVEMSRYMNKYKTPHVRACAATSEIDYVLSLIQYIKNRKDDRELLFSRLKILDISEFRSKYSSVIMPRMLFLVDEFQQLFLDANNRQKDVIEDLLTDITRKGRSSGVHLVFASQDMSGALSERQRTNFKVHFALSCDSSISNQILGNNAASRLPDKGQVICNKDSTLEADNTIYTVPFASNDSEIQGKDSYFDSILKEMSSLALDFRYQYVESQKFYQEELQYKIAPESKDDDSINLLTLLKNKKLFLKRSSLPDSIFASLILGRKVIHTNERYDIENILLERGKNRNILAISGNNADVAYLQKLFALNFASIYCPTNTIEYRNRFIHKVVDFNPIITTIYKNSVFEEDLKFYQTPFVDIYDEDKSESLCNATISYCSHVEELTDYVFSSFSDRKDILSILQDKEKCPNIRSFIQLTIEDWYRDNDYDLTEVMDGYLNGLFRDLKEDDSNLEEYLTPPEYEEFHRELQLYYRFRVLNIPSNLLFKPIIFWFKGIEVVERLPRWFEEFASNCMDVNIYCIFLSTSKVPLEVSSTCNYIFVSGSDSKLYDKYYDEAVLINSENIKVYCYVKNLNERFAFKKYRCKLDNIIEPRLNLDDILIQ